MKDLLENKTQIEEESLERLYAEWRRQADVHNAWEREHGGSIPTYWETDCGKSGVIEDFSGFANLKENISLEDMLGLERRYENKN